MTRPAGMTHRSSSVRQTGGVGTIARLRSFCTKPHTPRGRAASANLFRNVLPEHKQRIAHLIEQALGGLGATAQVPVVLERPKVASHGDLACNVALQIAKPLKKNPREIAQAIADALKTNPAAAGLLDAVEVAGPGFINLRLAAAAKQSI